MMNLLDLALASKKLAFSFVATIFFVVASAFDYKAFHLHSPFCPSTCLLGNSYLFISIGFIRLAPLVSFPVTTFNFIFNFIF